MLRQVVVSRQGLGAPKFHMRSGDLASLGKIAYNCRVWRICLWWWFSILPSGKRLHNYGKSPFSTGKPTISMAMFNSLLYVYQRPSLQIYANLCHGLILISCRPTLWHYPVLCPKATWEKQGKQGGGHVWNNLLVGGLEHEFSDFPYIGNSNPNWRTHIFQRGRYTTNQFLLVLNVPNFREWSTGQLSIIIRAIPIPIHSLLSTRKYFIHIPIFKGGNGNSTIKRLFSM